MFTSMQKVACSDVYNIFERACDREKCRTGNLSMTCCDGLEARTAKG